jgi:aryl-alcohol dehydrogenase-like predicted oxidoreductase
MPMQYRRLGASGLRVSELSLGSWITYHTQVDVTAAKEMLAAAMDAGVNFFDNAEVYARGQSEVVMGEAIKALKWPRLNYVVSTKFFWGLEREGNTTNRMDTLNRKYLSQAMDGSLKRMQLDFIDLVFCHRPDPHTPIEETLAALSELVTEGKVRYIGSSNLSGWQVVDADWTARSGGYEAFVSAQNEYSWLNREVEAELVPALDHTGQGLLPFFPLARGLLTGKYRRGSTAPDGSRLAGQAEVLAAADFDTVEALQAFADERGLTLLQIAIGGLAAMPTVASVIAGATKVSQIEANVAAGSWQPTADDLQTLMDLTA